MQKHQRKWLVLQQLIALGEKGDGVVMDSIWAPFATNLKNGFSMEFAETLTNCFAISTKVGKACCSSILKAYFCGVQIIGSSTLSPPSRRP